MKESGYQSLSNQLKVQSYDDEQKDEGNLNQLLNNYQNISPHYAGRGFYKRCQLQESYTNQIKRSPYFQKYQNQFRKGRKPPHFLNYNQNFLRYDITCLTQINFFQIQMVYHSRNYRIVHYKVRLSYFGFIVKIFNISNQDNFIISFVNEINKGMFGTVYQIKAFDKISAVKEILLERMPIITIKKAIYEYSLMKIMAGLQCGPKLDMIFGFDIIVTQKSLYFSAQKCLHVQDYVQFLDNQKFQQKFQELEVSLLQMHSLKICHNDIKPSNVLYSPSLNKLVLIDFGFSQIKTINLGQMQKVKAKGSFYYSCDDMKNAFTSATGFGLVDTYYNDYYALKKTKEILQSSLLYQYQQLNNQSINFNYSDKKNSNFYSRINNHISYLFEPKQVIVQQSLNHLNYQRQSLQKTFDYFVIFFCFLISQNRFKELQELLFQVKESIKLIDSKFLNIYWIFFEIDYIKQIHLSYKKIKQILLKKDIVSFQTKKIIQNILDPYFIQICNYECQQNLYLNLYMEKQKKIKQYLSEIYNQQNTHLNIHNYAKMDISQTTSNYYQKRSIYISFQDQLQNQKEYRIYLDKINRQQIDLICDIFARQDEIKMSVIFSAIEIQINHLQSNDCDVFKVIQALKAIFKNFKIYATTHKSDHKIFSIHQKSEMWLNFILELIISSIERFNLQTAILNLLESQSNLKYLHYAISFFKRKEQPQNMNKVFEEFENKISLKTQFCIQNSVKIFQQALVIWIKIFRLYITNLPYNKSVIKRDQFIRTLTQKILQVIEEKYEFQRNILSSKVTHVLNSLLQMQYLFIYQVGLNSFLKAQAKGDYKKVALYFNHLFNHQPYQKFISQCKHDLQSISNNNLIFYFSKDLCSLIAYKCVLPQRLSQKYKFSAQVSKVIEGIINKVDMVQNFQINQIKSLLFLQLYFALSNQCKYITAVKLFQKIIIFHESKQSEDFYYSFYLLWRQLNNNQKVKTMKKYLSEHFPKQNSSNPSFFKQNPSNLQVTQRKNTNKMTKFQNSTFSQNSNDSFKSNIISFNKDVSSINLPKTQSKDLLKKRFIQLANSEKYEIQLLNKLFCMRRIIEDEINAYPNQQGNLQFYLEIYQKLIDCFEKQIVDHLRTMKQLNISVPIYDFITNSFNDQMSLYPQIANRITQNQFWQQLKRGWILSEYEKIMFLLLKNQQGIYQKQLIFDMWRLTKQKVFQLFKEQQYPAYVLELQSQVYQCQYFQKFSIYKDNPSSQNQMIANQHYQKFMMSTKKYLTNMDSIVHLSPRYILQMKGNIFYPTALIKIFNKQITIVDFEPGKAKQLFINYCQYLIKQEQYYQVFRNGQVFENILDNIIRIGCDQLWTFTNKQRQNKLQKSPKNGFFLYNFMKAVGIFSQIYSCSNYTKTFLLIAEYIINQIQRMFCLNLNHQNNFLQRNKKTNPAKILNDHFYNFIRTLIYQIFSSLIIKQSIKCIKLIYLKFLNFILTILKYLSSSSFKKQDKIQFFLDKKQFIIEHYQCKVLLILDSSISSVSEMNFKNLQFNAKRISIELLISNVMDIFKLKYRFTSFFSIRKIQKLQLRSLRFFYNAIQFDQFQQFICLHRNQRNIFVHGVEVKKMFEKTFKNIKFHSITKVFHPDNENKNRYFEKIKQKIMARFSVLVTNVQNSSTKFYQKYSHDSF